MLPEDRLLTRAAPIGGHDYKGVFPESAKPPVLLVNGSDPAEPKAAVSVEYLRAWGLVQARLAKAS